MAFFKELANRHPMLKRQLIIAHIDKSPEEFVKQSLIVAFLLSACASVGVFLLVLSMEFPPWVIVPVFGLLIFLFYELLLRSPEVERRKRAKEIDKDVLFAGRFLLIKLNSGKPLMNAIVDASNSYGVANHYFKEIVRDIELGTPLEEALEKASRYSPSEKMRRILFQISNALKIGVDVTSFLEAILDEIAQDQLIEIQKYGRKLSGLTMFYMLLAIVIPSLGITMFITITSLVSIQADFGLLLVFLFGLVVVEFVFISIFKSIRPTVNI